MKNKGVQSRRRKRSAARRIRPFWIPLSLAGIVLVAAVTFAVLWPGFDPKHVVASGNRVVSSSDIVKAAQVNMNVNMWLQNNRAIARRVEAIPYIDVARVHRFPPSTVVVAVTERVPYAIVVSDGQPVVVDRHLRVLAPQYDAVALPTFTLPPGVDLTPGTFIARRDAISLANDYDAMIAGHVVPIELHYDKFGGLVATVRGDIQILLGDDADLAKKLPLVDPILAQDVRKERRVSEVDLRAPGTPVVVYR
ncbi:MAG TPA: FtsQ-type POTRA domain-containing protein [Candidatus Tumulicola sp.]